MSHEFLLTRYAAYYRGWCQAFGEHRSILGSDKEISWLITPGQVGFILSEHLTRQLHREILRHRETPTLTIGHHSVEIGDFHYDLTRRTGHSALDAIRDLLESGIEGHIYLTSHIMYGMGTRILTFSSKKPVPIIYKQIGTMRVRLK